MALVADGELLIVETDDDRFVGTVEFVDGGLVVRNGYVGHPTMLRAEEVIRLAPALLIE